MADNVITTVKGREKLAKAHMGTAALPAITQIGFGTGGHDTGTGLPLTPTGTETVVPGEVLKKNITSFSFPVATTAEIVGVLDYSEANGVSISAFGLYDSAGDLVALKYTTPKPKASDTRLEITWDEQF
ncbi:phage tail protein [Acetobacterium wieringae]|uniref:phage tail-collar fiber domain-containing protein n=1 Tax=Acetobacterium wieringae TaxID=52694 RepID=UPI002B1F77EF|nr:phage tail protein [Acetobacterium wieringae]MEA4805073.1 phage tail protein [Acetobacterium wieringae]